MVNPTKSAGGIVLNYRDNELSILIVELEESVEEKWAPVLRQLPKGGCNPGESLEQTALREVLEETGYESQIISKAGTVSWSYIRDGQDWVETVHYFFMVPLSITPREHDFEFDSVRWIRIEEAAHILSYPEERELLKKLLADNGLPKV